MGYVPLSGKYFEEEDDMAIVPPTYRPLNLPPVIKLGQKECLYCRSMISRERESCPNCGAATFQESTPMERISQAVRLSGLNVGDLIDVSTHSEPNKFIRRD